MNRRKREQRKNRSAAANVRRRLRERYLPDSKTAKASEYLYHLKEYYKQHPDMIAMLYNRESSRSQDDNHATNERVLRHKCKKLGIPVASLHFETISGKILDEDRQALSQAVRKARAKINKGEQAVILATSSDRFIRSRSFNPKTNPDILPSEAQFKRLRKLARGVPLVTLLHPDMPPRKVRRYQTKWGQKVKGNSGGRPKINKPGYMKLRQQIKLPPVLRRRKKGESLGAISKSTGVPKSTVADWVRKYG